MRNKTRFENFCKYFEFYRHSLQLFKHGLHPQHFCPYQLNHMLHCRLDQGCHKHADVLLCKAPISPFNCFPVRINISLGSAFEVQPISSIVLTQLSSCQIELQPQSPLREQSTQSSRTLHPIAIANITMTWKSQTVREWREPGDHLIPAQNLPEEETGDKWWHSELVTQLIPSLALFLHYQLQTQHPFLNDPFCWSHDFAHLS